MGDDPAVESLIFGEAQLLLAEKRTSLSTLRTGIAVAALPLSITSALIATSRLYDPHEVAHLLVPVLVTCALLLGLGGYLIVRAIVRIRNYDRLLHGLREESARVARYLD